MNFNRMYGLFLRHFFLIKSSFPRILDLIYWPSIQIMLWGFICMAYTIGTGIGTWGLNKTIDWAWDITNFVWWIGIGVGAFSAIIHLPVKETPYAERAIQNI